LPERGRVARTLGVVGVALVAMLIAGCGGTSLVTGAGSTSTSPPTSPRSSSEYLAALGAAQARLAAAERRIPAVNGRPAALSEAIGSLHAAIVGLESDLSSIEPPVRVAALHARLVAITRAYAASLEQARAAAGRPGGQLGAGNLLIAATGDASRAFSKTVERITAALAG
jgi:hypothetical protein